NGCELSASRLVRGVDGTYSIDFEDLERRCSEESARVMVLCNPHNPTGRIWTADELERIARICASTGTFVISDEIHCELTYCGREYTPFATIAPAELRYAICVSPSKAFNTAGLQIANIVASDAEARALIDRAINDNEVCDVNPFGVAATVAAYTHCAPWLDELRSYLWENWLTVKDYFARHLPSYGLTPLESTYLVWIDCRHTGMDSDALNEKLIEAGVALSPGSIYGDPGFLRLNIACPRSRLKEGLSRMGQVLAELADGRIC
ncbi:MAG: aminotransferase class I/II-fold pyridoxal phosphate-dependent enzyme, partial [Muribaculaceae bacterium]|nr:aminotransferase class I/II-fold pyridoxal phosphate-dependent enzyme [Muribaculaceae bacterium]